MLNNKEIMEIAKAQLAKDYHCKTSDFETLKVTITERGIVRGRRIYISDGCLLKAICFDGSAVFTAYSSIHPWLSETFSNKEVAWLFDYNNIKVLDSKLIECGSEIADIHQYYLPYADYEVVLPKTQVKWYEKEAISQFREDSRIEEAFAFEPNYQDVLAVAAFDGDEMMGIAGASADGVDLWQIGIDVFPDYRGQGIGTNLVALLKQEILKRGKVPFYGTVMSHIHSQRIAIKAGFYPAWVELYTQYRNLDNASTS